MTILLATTSAQSVSCPNTPESRLVIGEQALVIAEGGINFRLVPSVESLLLNIIPKDAIIPVIDGPFCAEGLAWWQVDYDGDRGWVAEGIGEFYWLAPYVIQRAQIGTVRAEVQPNLVTGITIERLADPLRSQFVLEGYPIATNQIVPFIVIFDTVPESILQSESVGNAVAHELDFSSGGTRFVDIYFTEPLEDANEITLIYHYLFITEDNRFIDTYFPISAANLPLAYNAPATNIESYNTQYLEDTADALDSLTGDDFRPTLAQLDGIVQSIQIHAPIEESDTVTFISSGITVDYNPVFATGITEELIPERDIPRHIQLTFNNYPSPEEAVIRIYSVQDVDGSTISTLQQILDRQPSNPPRIPVLSQPDAPLLRDELTYLHFLNGNGVRYVVSFEEGKTLMSYQGITDTGDFYVSALFPTENDYPPISIFDLLIQTLRVGE